ncbi:uncharacterized protein [Rutidosis leptorrhynchoides]|uniref:uncharacterized protein n=1 Tax=Rutidosis leptorrhynchoides TaxID=125765 RepID=UPI003A99A619
MKKRRWVNWNAMSSSKSKGGLGLRDFKAFNLALLVKQGWRIMQEPDSLLAQTLKKKYFPVTSFLEAELGSNPSFVWRSILEGRELLERESGLWNVRLLHSLFRPRVASAIGKTPVLPFNSDLLAWKNTKNDMFTGRSTYFVALELRKSKDYSPPVPRFWKIIWKLQLVFPSLDVGAWQNENFFQWYFRMHDLLDSNSWTSLNVGLWVTWKNRNDAWSSSLCVVPKSAALLVEHVKTLSCRPTLQPFQQQQSRPSRGWHPPPQGTVKINSDAALYNQSGFWGLRIIMRDHLGETLCYKSIFEQGFMDICYAEAVALLQGVLLALSFGFFHVIFESDAMLVVNDAISIGTSFLSYRNVLEMIRTLARNFISCKFIFVPRSGNMLAHYIVNLKSNG